MCPLRRCSLCLTTASSNIPINQTTFKSHTQCWSILHFMFICFFIFFLCSSAFLTDWPELSLPGAFCASFGDRVVRRRHCVGGGAPVNVGRPPPVQRNRRRLRRRRGVGRQKNFFQRFSKKILKILFYSQNFLMAFFQSSIGNCMKISNKLSPPTIRRSQIVGGGGRRTAVFGTVLVETIFP